MKEIIKLVFVREMLNKESMLKSKLTITLNGDENSKRELLEKTLFYKEDDEYKVLDCIKWNINNINGLKDCIKIMKNEEISAILENFLDLSLKDDFF